MTERGLLRSSFKGCMMFYLASLSTPPVFRVPLISHMVGLTLITDNIQNTQLNIYEYFLFLFSPHNSSRS